MLDLDFVITIHDEIIAELGGLPGFGGGGKRAVEAALHRVETHAHYEGLDDVFGIAALYAVAIARGHVFNDANKRTGLTCALAYLASQDIHLPQSELFEELMVAVADGTLNREDFGEVLGFMWSEREHP